LKLGVLPLLLLLAAPAAAADDPTLVLERGGLARHEIVAVGRDVVVDGEALSDVAVISGSARIAGSVAGDVLVMGGSAHLAPSARVTGDVLVLGGSLDAAPGATIGGRAVSYPTVAAAWLTLAEGPALGASATSPLVIGAKLALLAAWAALLVLFFAASGRELLATAEAVRREPLRAFVVGLTGVLALVLTAVFFLALAAALVGLPLLVLVVILALVLKLWGMVAVFHALGDFLARRMLRRRVLPLTAACLGLAALGLLKFLPWVGTMVWTAATLLGVGATLITKFGRREPWFLVRGLEQPAL